MRTRDLVDRDTPAGRRFGLAILALIALDIAAFSLETLPDLPARLRSALRAFEVLSVGIFSAEYLLRLTFAERRLRFATSFFGLVDLIAILPFYLAIGFDLRSLRSLRFLRLFRTLKIVRYSRAVRRMREAIKLVSGELVVFGTTSAILLYIAAVGIYYCERDAQPEVFRSVFDGLWWAVATLTTVGYGDVYPVTAGGRAFTVAILVLGLGVVAVPAGLFASALSSARSPEVET